MTSEPIMRIRALAAVAVLGGGVTLTACSSDSSGAGDSGAATGECALGDTVGQPATKGGVPPCADKSGVTTKTYGCYPDPGGPAQGSWYLVTNSNGTVMYGKPGGVWKQAESSAKPQESLIQQIGC